VSDDAPRCGPEYGVAFSMGGPTPTVGPMKGCRHGQRHWHHVHWRLGGQPICRIECRCGKVMAHDGRVGLRPDEIELWWRDGVFDG
jgi:hypothetical protein